MGPSPATTSAILPPVGGAWAVLQAVGPNWVIVAQSNTVVPPFGLNAATYTIQQYDSGVLGGFSGTMTVTLPPPGNNQGRLLYFANHTAHVINSASSNVVGTGGTLQATITGGNQGDWAILMGGASDWLQVAFGGP